MAPGPWRVQNMRVHVHTGQVAEVHLERRTRLPGYCIVVWRPGHAAEPTGPGPAAAGRYWQEVLTAGVTGVCLGFWGVMEKSRARARAALNAPSSKRRTGTPGGKWPGIGTEPYPVAHPLAGGR